MQHSKASVTPGTSISSRSADSSTGEQDSSRLTPAERGVAFATRAGSIAASTSAASARPSLITSHRTAEPDQPRFRYTIAIIVTLAYVCLLGAMFYANTLTPSLGFAAELNSQGKLIVTHIVPGSVANDAGVSVGDIVIRVDDRPVGKPLQAGPMEFTSDYVVTVQHGANEVVVSSDELPINPFQRWSYALLGLFFISVGGPVFVKARQRSAAITFYTFTVSTALAFAFAIGTSSARGIVMGMTFISLVLFAGSFAYFFFEFPVRVGKDNRQHNLIIGVLMLSGAAVLGSYIFTLVSDPNNYAYVRILMVVFLAACVSLGVGRMIRSFLTERSPEVRQQLVLLAVGSALAISPSLFLSLLPMLFFGKPIVSMEVTAVTLGLLPLAFAYAITQHQLLGVRNFVRRGVVYIIMGSAVLLVFSVAAAGLNAWLGQGWEQHEIGLIGFGLFVFLIAFSYSRLQTRVEKLVDRYIYHDAYDYKEALLEFSSQLASEQKLQVLADQLVERTCRLMNLTCGVLLLAVDPNSQFHNITSHDLAIAGIPPLMLDGLDISGDITQPIGGSDHESMSDPSAWRKRKGLMRIQSSSADGDDIYLEMCAKSR